MRIEPGRTAPMAHPQEAYSGAETYKISAIYPSREEAEAVRTRLVEAGVDAGAMSVMHDQASARVERSSDEVLKDMVVEGAIGTAVGTGVGAIGTVLLWASGATLFLASPVVAPLAMLGWFAGVGGLIGAAAGADTKRAERPGTLRKEGKFSELVLDAIKSGNAVLAVRTRDKSEKELAKKIIAQSLQGREDSPAS